MCRFLPHVFFLLCVRMSSSLSKIVRLKRCILFWALCNEASYYSWLYCAMYIVSLMCCSLWDLASVQCWQFGLTKQWPELFQLNLLRNWYSHSLILPICGHSSREILQFPLMRIPPIWELLTCTVAIIMVALWNRADHYIFMLWFVLPFFFFFFPRLISAATDWMSTVLRHMVWS